MSYGRSDEDTKERVAYYAERIEEIRRESMVKVAHYVALAIGASLVGATAGILFLVIWAAT